MQNQLYNRDELVQYLLGASPEEETERFDELSVTDDDFAEHLQIIEADLIDEYVRGELSPTEHSRFQSNYLLSPRRREAVRFAHRFQEFAKARVDASAVNERSAEPLPLIQAQPSLRTADSEKGHRAPERKSFWEILTVPQWGMRWGVAMAGLILLAAGGWIGFETYRLRNQLAQIQQSQADYAKQEQQLRQQIAQQNSDRDQLTAQLRRIEEERERLQQELEKRDQSKPNFSFFIFPQAMRGGEIKDLLLTHDIQFVKLRLEFESDEYSRFQVQLRTQSSDRILWSGDNFKANVNRGINFIYINIPARHLISQGYVLSLIGVSSSGNLDPVRDYSFRVIRN